VGGRPLALIENGSGAGETPAPGRKQISRPSVLQNAGGRIILTHLDCFFLKIQQKWRGIDAAGKGNRNDASTDNMGRQRIHFDGSVRTTTALAFQSALVNTGTATNRLVIP
jgi:hypothetical protein